MAKSIVISNEYVWTASFGLFDWVIEFLITQIGDPPTSGLLRRMLDEDRDVLNLRELSLVGRREIISVFRESIAIAAAKEAVDDATFAMPMDQRRFVVGRIKELKLIADDVTGDPATRDEYAEKS